MDGRPVVSDAGQQDSDWAKIIEQEVQLVHQANSTRMPAWLGTASPGFAGLDYSRFRPRGLYTSHPRLSRYFQATTWLQAVPFRTQFDVDLTAFLLIGRSTVRSMRSSPDDERRRSIFSFYAKLLGLGDDLDLQQAGRLADNASGDFEGPLADLLSSARTALEEKVKEHGNTKIQDQVASADPPSTRPILRFLSARRLPDATWFAMSTRNGRAFPRGLEVAALLGSEFATDWLIEKDKGFSEKLLRKNRESLRSKSLYQRYLDCLSTLVEKAPHSAPDLFRSKAWQVHACDTALASWAQMRHAWVLQAKRNVTYLCLTGCPPGFVEPNPRFYRRLADLVALVADHLDVDSIDPAFASKRVRLRTRLMTCLPWIRSCRNYRQLTKRVAAETSWGPEFQRSLIRALRGLSARQTGKDVTDRSSPKSCLHLLRKWMDHLVTHESRSAPFLVRNSSAGILEYEMSASLEELWLALERMARRLESLSHRQLRKVAFGEQDRAFLQTYGEKLARLMFYEGNSYLHPHDDSPRIADIFVNPQKGQILHVGTARPRALFILYPTASGKVHLCQGAVQTYYEYRNPTPLTDQQWKTLLDSQPRPKRPPWIPPKHP